ncbi:beta-ketoacyl-ACP synthase III [Campylobacter lari]|uniref:3-oxoacyl-[acyl-carrier-protein] synthase III C-terminal domain-containing protein n=1 Tax=Campylobacter lari TaxID=201 RepID=UPI0012BFAFF1|nr:3-oxoacyl-[acyl-carrier-protein] synthase III C-terminal domain-containing protein [Campylobacter lari]EAK0442726.1 beta-ketoacyl-ACP synthase III [Campylobacter lari]EGK8095009.1 beta-ketoacyl-ACP synthase III [Campylobacter lari]EHH0538386.1 beta-ketoacyl-ACP synthase III [Campylobacter lari]MCW0188514.1 beta-ketoacyl-ACP synthase III [Campylobacter lari]MCW0243573.1 beta-ketoacyl-ACP synthase III [Campylobacter lari]
MNEFYYKGINIKARFDHVKITSIASVVPETKISVDLELKEIYGNDLKKIKKIKNYIGLQYRHVVNNETVIDLSQKSIEILLKETKTDKNSIDAIIVVTQTPDYFIPTTACCLHGKLNFPQSTLAFDINQACAGYLYGLYVSHSMIEHGGCKKILLICGSTSSKLEYDFSNQVKIRGDAASATLLEYTKEKNISFFDLRTDGKGFQNLIVPFGAFANPNIQDINEPELWEAQLKDKQVYMNGLKIFNFAIQEEPKAFEDLLHYANIKKEHLDYIFFHQANKSMVDTIIKKLQLNPSKTPNKTIEKYGNINASSIPVTICDTLGNDNQLSNMTVCLAGFGAGLSWANAILSLDKYFNCKKTYFYKKGEIK